MGIDFAIAVTDGEERQDLVPESVIQALPPYPLAQPGHPSLLAWRKANAAREAGHSAAILGADTIVVLDDIVLGKPRDPAHARQMLRQLSGRYAVASPRFSLTARLDTAPPPPPFPRGQAPPTIRYFCTVEWALAKLT